MRFAASGPSRRGGPSGTGPVSGARQEALRLADAFEAKVVDATVEHFLFELTGKVSKVDQFIAIMRPLGLVEICRTGPASMNRGPQGM